MKRIIKIEIDWKNWLQIIGFVLVMYIIFDWIALRLFGRGLFS